MMTNTAVTGVPKATAERDTEDILPAPRPPLQEALPATDPLTFILPEDVSGLATNLRGPLAPELYNLLSSHAPTAAASSSSSSIATGGDTSTTTAAASASGYSSKSSSSVALTMEMQKARAAEFTALLQEAGPTKTVRSKFTCRLCGQPKDRKHGHTRYGKEHYCSNVGGKSLEDWLQEKRAAAKTKVGL